MKFIVACLLFGVALAAPQNPQSAAAPAPQARSEGSAVAPARPNYGPKVYGPGLNNPFAFPHNPFAVRSAAALANSHPGLLVRVNVDGEVEFTDRFGREVDGVYDTFGNDLSDLYEF